MRPPTRAPEAMRMRGGSIAGALLLAIVVVGGCRRAGALPTKHHYDDKEAALAHFEEPERDAWAKPGEVIEAIGIGPDWEVADIGAGSGYFTRRLAHAASGGTTYAIDVDADFKGHIEGELERWGTPNIVTRLAVYEHPLLPKESVDLVFISNTYSFLDARVSYFEAVHAALRRNGKLVVIDWRKEVKCPRPTGCPRPKQRIPKSTAIEELGQAGFTVVEEFDFLPYQYFLLLERKVDIAAREAEPPPKPKPQIPIMKADPVPMPEPEPEPEPTTVEPPP